GGDHPGGADPRGVWLHAGLSRGEVDARRQGAQHLRGNHPDPEAGHDAAVVGRGTLARLREQPVTGGRSKSPGRKRKIKMAIGHETPGYDIEWIHISMERGGSPGCRTPTDCLKSR